ncbi:MAG: helix-hairpin-helix domain-containing protein [Campylobacteraceae bacterium]|jgi:competence protein ComEA|nr:helix-hairpin-helix domain-containing protein [Campylobacteraceae bacterium]
MKFVAFLLLFVSFLFAKLDLNTASEAELQKVKGVGPAKAKAIVEYRQKNGSFKSVDDLKNVKGFGEKSVASLKSDLEVKSALTNAPAKK